jgi:hypothetical protein
MNFTGVFPRVMKQATPNFIRGRKDIDIINYNFLFSLKKNQNSYYKIYFSRKLFLKIPTHKQIYVSSQDFEFIPILQIISNLI